ncbi:transposase [Enterococcus faecium]|nr:transposase [Enterococcus faecium]AVJ41309.1 hypothetical protein CXH17_00690 [Enterococcus faecium]AVJ42432.1 hypothetical protein CXH17_07085 [Enterococcus faecium]
MNDSIKKMLRITEKDLMITEVSYETLQKKKTLVVDAVLSPTPRACRSCGSTVVDGNGKAIIVKNGKKETIVRFEQYNHMPLVMRLKKQRYTCKNCRTHWTELRKAGQKSQAEKLKKNWRFLLKNRANINHYEYKTWKSFRAPKYPFLTEAMMIDRLLEFSPPLKEAYPFFHELVEAFRDKDPDLFFSLLAELPETLDDSFREKLQNLLTYEEGITNAMIYPYSNGKIEAKNTHIKTMKRVSYGFKSFENMRIRIFLINQLINVR